MVFSAERKFSGLLKIFKHPKVLCQIVSSHDASWGLKGGILYSENQEVLVNYQHVGGWDIGLPGGRSFPATATARLHRN